MQGRVEHIVWDWNGTLFADSDVIIAATCDMFAELGFGPLTPDRYRATFTHPLTLFYERLVGRPLSDDELLHISHAFYAAYRRLVDTCDLSPGAREALRRWQDDGRTQSLLSLNRHERLLRRVTALGLDGLFLRVDGLRETIPTHKADMLVRHLTELGRSPNECLLIGDSVDDAVAAGRVGARSVLYASGQHTRESLEAVGVPVVDSLDAAMHLAMAG